MKKIILIIILMILLNGLGIAAYHLTKDKQTSTSALAIVDNVNWNVSDSYNLIPKTYRKV